PVEAREHRGRGCSRWLHGNLPRWLRDPAHVLGVAGRFDLDHIGTQVAQYRGSQGAGNGRSKRDDPDTCEGRGLHGLPMDPARSSEYSVDRVLPERRSGAPAGDEKWAAGTKWHSRRLEVSHVPGRLPDEESPTPGLWIPDEVTDGVDE